MNNDLINKINIYIDESNKDIKDSINISDKLNKLYGNNDQEIKLNREIFAKEISKLNKEIKEEINKNNKIIFGLNRSITWSITSSLPELNIHIYSKKIKESQNYIKIVQIQLDGYQNININSLLKRISNIIISELKNFIDSDNACYRYNIIKI